MATTLRPLLSFSILVSFFLLSSAQSCLKYKFAGNKNFKYCNDLPFLDSYIHYTHNAAEGSLQFAYRHIGIKKPGTWVSWAINPVNTGMELAQAFVAYPRNDGTLSVYTSQLLGEKPRLMSSEIMFQYSNLAATYANNEVVIFAKVILPENRTTFNTIWQEGPIRDEIPVMHDIAMPNMMSRANLDFLSGLAIFNRTIPFNSVQQTKNLHATFNVIGWGVMMPIGTILGRYLKVIESADQFWIYIHITWQLLAYIVGVTGWVIGVRIGGTIHQAKDITHRALGYTLFLLSTLQVLALFLRPKKEHKYRPYWNMYHKLVGHAIVIIAIINVFKGFTMLSPVRKWMREYTGTIFVLFLIGVFLEVYTRQLIQKRNQRMGILKQPTIQLGYNASDGYEGRDRYGI